MKKYLFLLMLPLALSSQIPGPNGLNMPGTWNNAFQNPPSNAAFGGSQTTNGRIQPFTEVSTPIYQTTFSVNTTGADVTGGTYQWLFTSGPLSAPQSHIWSDVTVILNSVQTYNYYSGTGGFNNQVTLNNGKWYTVNWLNSGSANTKAIFMETSAQPVGITNLTTSQGLNDVYLAPMQVTITTTGTPASDQFFYIRYSTDNFVTSNIGQFTMSGNTGVFSFPGLNGGEDYTFYIFSSAVSNLLGNQSTEYYDLRTLTVNNNGGSNYTFFVNNSAITTSTGGSYTDPTTWRGGAIPNSTNITVAAGATLTISSLFLYVSNLTVQTNGTFISQNSTIFFNPNATINNNGTVTLNGTAACIGKATFNGQITSNVEFYINDSTTFNTSPIVGAATSFILNTNGRYFGQPPIYQSSSTLRYNGGVRITGDEWTAGGGSVVGVTPGYPYNVDIAMNTNASLKPRNVQYTIANNLNIVSSGLLILSDLNDSNMVIKGDLFINQGGILSMSNMTKRLVVEGSLNLSGDLGLSSQPGGDLEVKGPLLSLTSSGFISGTNAIIFSGQSTTISASSTKTYHKWIIEPGCTLITTSFNLFLPDGSILNNGHLESNSIISLISDASNPDQYAKLLNFGTIGGSGAIARQLSLPLGQPNSNPASSDFNDGKNGRWYSIGVPYPNVSIYGVANPTTGVIFNNTHPSIFMWNPNTGNYQAPSVFSNYDQNMGYALYAGENQHGIFTRDLLINNQIDFVYNNPTNPTLTTNFGYTNSPVFQNISGNNAGWNMAVNPFLTTYNLKNTQVSNAVATAHIYNPNTGNFITYNFNEPTDFWISPNQAFWIRATSTGGSITFNQANQSLVQSINLKKPQTSIDYAFLKLINGTDEDALRIYFRGEATDAFDELYDADKMPRDIDKASIYTTSSCNSALAVSALPLLTGYRQIPLYVTGQLNKALTIELSDYSLSAVGQVILEDRLTSTFHTLTDGSYTFQHSSTNASDRFILHLGLPAVSTDEILPAAKSLQTWYANDFIYILSESSISNGSCEVIDMMGRVVKKITISLPAGHRTSYSIADVPAGSYVLRMQSGTTVTTQKFVK